MIRRRKAAVAPFAVLIAFSILGATPVFADTSTTGAATSSSETSGIMTRDQAIAQIQKLLSIPDEDVLQSANYFSGNGTGQKPTWYFSWQDNKQDGKSSGGIGATVDANSGSILSFNQWTNDTVTYPPAVDQEAAQLVASDLIAKLQPQQAKEVKLIPIAPPPYAGGGLQGSVTWQFRFERIVNGIPAPFDGFQVGVNGNGLVTNYTYQWSDVTFADSQADISSDQADLAYASSLHMALSYQPVWSKGGNPNQQDVRLIYHPAYPDLNNEFFNGIPTPVVPPIIDAHSGTLVDTTDMPITEVVTVPPQAINPGQPDQPPQALSSPLTSDIAQQLAEQFANIDSTYTLQNTSYNDWNRQQPTWSFNWIKKADQSNVSVTINALTGQVRDFNIGGPPINSAESSAQGSAISPDHAKQSALGYVKKIFPGRLGVLYYKSTNPAQILPKPTGAVQQASRYIVNFGQLVNGTPTEQDSLSVQVDASSGAIVGLYSNLDTPSTYPDASKVISADEAKVLWEKQYPLTLVYMIPMKPDRSGLQSQAVPVYTPQAPFGQTVLLDAQSGEWFDPNASVKNGSGQPATDIGTHWGSKAMQLLIDKGVLDVIDGKVHPDQKITVGDFITLLVRAFRPAEYGALRAAAASEKSSDQYIPYIQAAVTAKWLNDTDHLDPRATLTRVEMAKLLVRVVGYEKIATHSDIFKVPYTDSDSVEKSDLGYVAVAYALGMMQGSQHQFHPNSDVSIAAVSVAFMNTLNALNTINSPAPIYAK